MSVKYMILLSCKNVFDWKFTSHSLINNQDTKVKAFFNVATQNILNLQTVTTIP